MKRPIYSVGIDLAALTFYASIHAGPGSLEVSREFPNDTEGFEAFMSWLDENHASKGETLVCMEATGVYGEKLCLYLYINGYQLAVEAPHKVKRAFSKLTKNDKVDSMQIAEYTHRFFDQLTRWEPKRQVLEEIGILLTTREQLVSQQTANKNALKALELKNVCNGIALKALREANATLEAQLKEIFDEIMRLIKSDGNYAQLFTLVTSIPAIGPLFFANLLVLTDGFAENVNPKKLAALIGIAPYEHTSGSSVRKRTKSTGRGPHRMRKLVFLAAMNAKGKNPQMKRYYERKEREGKHGSIILNNIANKFIRVICAMVRDRTQFFPNHISLNPMLMSA